MKKRGKIKTAVLVLGDFALFYLALALSLVFRYYSELDFRTFWSHVLPFGVNFLIWAVFLGAFGLYEMKGLGNAKHFLYRLLQGMVFNTLLSSTFFYFFPFFGIEPRRNLLLTIILSTVFIFLWRLVFKTVIAKTPQTHALFFGANKEIVELADYLLKNPQLGHRPLGFLVDENTTHPITLPFYPYNLESGVAKIISDTKANAVIVTKEIKENRTLVKMLFQAIPTGISVIDFHHYHEMLTGKIPLSLIEEMWFLENLVGTKKQFYEFFKRILDIALAASVGIITTGLFPIIALGMILSTPGDIIQHRKRRAREGDGIIFFQQKRVGRGGKIFNFVKFRSQRLGAEKMGDFKEIIRDPRQYSFGAFMRKFYLDELPQIWNVLKGDMSFVGPRPERLEYVEELKKQVLFYETRLLVTPGLTGWAQINMENDADVKDAPEKMQYDLYYIKNRSFVLDLLIAFRTLSTILRRQGR